MFAKHMYMINTIRILYSLAFLIIFSIQDYKSREIDDRLVYVFTVGSVLLFIINLIYAIGILDLYIVLIYIGFAIMISPILTGILYVMGFIGKGDVYVITSLGLIYTFPHTITRIIDLGFNVMPPLLIIMIYSTALIVLFSIINAIYNCIVNRQHLKKLPLKYRVIYMFVARPIRIRDYIRKKYYFPLEIIDIRDGALSISRRINVNVEKENFDLIANKYRKLCDQGIISADTHIWVSYGIPFIVPLTIGFIMYLLIGDTIILHIFM